VLLNGTAVTENGNKQRSTHPSEAYSFSSYRSCTLQLTLRFVKVPLLVFEIPMFSAYAKATPLHTIVPSPLHTYVDRDVGLCGDSRPFEQQLRRGGCLTGNAQLRDLRHEVRRKTTQEWCLAVEACAASVEKILVELW
jgi:hypothetical protein